MDKLRYRMKLRIKRTCHSDTAVYDMIFQKLYLLNTFETIRILILKLNLVSNKHGTLYVGYNITIRSNDKTIGCGRCCNM